MNDAMTAKYVAPPVGAPLVLWTSHPLFERMATKANQMVVTHANNIAHNEGRLAGTVRFKTGQTEWTKEEARAFLRGRCGWTRPIVQLALLEAYEYGRCLPDCRFCHGVPFKELTEHGMKLGKLSLDVFNPRSAIPKFGHLTGFRCHDYNRLKAGRCLDEWADYLDLIEQAPCQDACQEFGRLSAATRHFRAGRKLPLPTDQPMF